MLSIGYRAIHFRYNIQKQKTVLAELHLYIWDLAEWETILANGYFMYIFFALYGVLYGKDLKAVPIDYDGIIKKLLYCG